MFWSYQIHNDDGVWLRLSQASINEWCKEGHVEGWALQYNQHLGKTLLVPVEEPKPLMEEIIKETIRKNLHDVVKPEVTPKRGQFQFVKLFQHLGIIFSHRSMPSDKWTFENNKKWNLCFKFVCRTRRVPGCEMWAFRTQHQMQAPS